MKCIMIGISKEHIKRMVEYMYGATVWEVMASGKVVTYPTSDGMVIMEPQPPSNNDPLIYINVGACGPTNIKGHGVVGVAPPSIKYGEGGVCRDARTRRHKQTTY